MTVGPSSRAALRALVAAFCGSIATGCWIGAGATPSGAGTTCVAYPSDIVEQLSWSSDGQVLAIRSVKPGANSEEVSLLLWPSLERRAVGQGDPGEILEPLVPADDGETAYVWFAHSGHLGIWTMREGSDPSLFGPEFVGKAAGQLFWTSDGIALTTVPHSSPGLVTIGLIRWDGEEVILRSETREGGADWVSGDGRWIVSPEGVPGQTALVVYHDGSRSQLHPSVDAHPVGMTPDRDAVVYKAFGGLDPPDQLVLRVLPLSGAAERSLTVHLETHELGSYVLSSQGDLAYTGRGEQRHQICVAHVDFENAN